MRYIKNQNPFTLSLLHFISLNQSKYDWNNVEHIGRRLKLIHDVLMKFNVKENTFKFSLSLHNFLNVFATLDITDYTYQLTTEIEQIFENTIGKVSKAKDGNGKIICANHLLLILFPLYWVTTISFMVDELLRHNIPNIDNEKITNDIRDRLRKARYAAELSIKSIHANVTKIITSSCDIMQNSSFVYNENDIIQHIFLCKITSIRSKTHHVIQSQFNRIINKFFGNSYFLPRTIPFSQGQQLKLILTSEYFILTSNEKNSNMYISLPYQLLWIPPKDNKKLSQKFVTPVGKFELVFTEAYPLVSIIDSKQCQAVPPNKGESLFQKNKDKIFQCLISYATSQDLLLLKSVIIRAGDERECEDICYAHLKEVTSSPIIYYSISAVDITNSEDDLIMV